MSKNKQNYHSSQKVKAEYKKAKEAAMARAIEEHDRKVQSILKNIERAKQKAKLPENMIILEDISPKFGEHLRHNNELKEMVDKMLKQPSFVRKIEDWKPQGKSKDTLFDSLANHLFARYKTPSFIWSAFRIGGEKAVALAVFIGSGKSLYHAHKEGLISVPVTRQMSHAFSQCTSEFTIIQAIRFAQTIGFGGDKRLGRAIGETRIANSFFTTIASEDFISSTIQWFCNQHMMDPSKVGPLWDYIEHVKRQNANYSLKGRNADSLIRNMEEWHAELRNRRYQRQNIELPKSGHKGAVYDFGNEENKQIWRIFELVTSDQLYDEGRRMGHCVGSYVDAVLNGRCSIWALTKEDNTGNWAMCTIEVDAMQKRLVQVRGRYNRMPTQQENQMLSRWSSSQKLSF